mmetsp:Transcript_147206/g.472803  ORF Transcript_147206/g.472803 Transcript_147206/m.472803 type:complete len:773 (+) Transcript_147206:713-3031(+)
MITGVRLQQPLTEDAVPRDDMGVPDDGTLSPRHGLQHLRDDSKVPGLTLADVEVLLAKAHALSHRLGRRAVRVQDALAVRSAMAALSALLQAQASHRRAVAFAQRPIQLHGLGPVSEAVQIARHHRHDGRPRGRGGPRPLAIEAAVLAAPDRLGDGPAALPSTVAVVAIVGRPRGRTGPADALAAPGLFLGRPARLPFQEAGLTVVWHHGRRDLRGMQCHRRRVRDLGAASRVAKAAPALRRRRPASLPIRVARRAIVRLRAAPVVLLAAPGLLRVRPSSFPIGIAGRAIEHWCRATQALLNAAPHHLAQGPMRRLQVAIVQHRCGGRHGGCSLAGAAVVAAAPSLLLRVPQLRLVAPAPRAIELLLAHVRASDALVEAAPRPPLRAPGLDGVLGFTRPATVDAPRGRRGATGLLVEAAPRPLAHRPLVLPRSSAIVGRRLLAQPAELLAAPVLGLCALGLGLQSRRLILADEGHLLRSAATSRTLAAPPLLLIGPAERSVAVPGLAVERGRRGGRRRAASACILAAPVLLVGGPAGLPIREPRRAIERLSHRRRRRRRCADAALAAVLAAPALLLVRPALLPIRQLRAAVVGQRRQSWGGLRAALAEVLTAPGLLEERPSMHPVGVARTAVKGRGRRLLEAGDAGVLATPSLLLLGPALGQRALVLHAEPGVVARGEAAGDVGGQHAKVAARCPHCCGGSHPREPWPLPAQPHSLGRHCHGAIAREAEDHQHRGAPIQRTPATHTIRVVHRRRDQLRVVVPGTLAHVGVLL